MATQNNKNYHENSRSWAPSSSVFKTISNKNTNKNVRRKIPTENL